MTTRRQVAAVLRGCHPRDAAHGARILAHAVRTAAGQVLRRIRNRQDSNRGRTGRRPDTAAGGAGQDTAHADTSGPKSRTRPRRDAHRPRHGADIDQIGSTALAVLAAAAAVIYYGRALLSHITTTQIASAAAVSAVLLYLTCAALSEYDSAPTTQADADPTDTRPADLTKPAPDEPPETIQPAPTREALTTALHHLVGTGRGVLLTTLRDHLHQPHTRAVRQTLGAASITTREGVRTTAGNGPGVHRDNFPPLLPSPDPSEEEALAPLTSANNATNTNTNKAANTPGEGATTTAAPWTPDERTRGFRAVNDPERGPNAWRIEHRKEAS